jgi:hypothetical protein
MRISIFTIILAAMSGPVFATCPASTQTVLSCTMSNGKKVLDVCQDGDFASYAFGKRGQRADMRLKVSIGVLEYTPWNGIGRAIYEQVIFRNRDVSYVVWSAFERDPGVVDPLRAGIRVEDRNENSLAELRCDAGSIRAGIDSLYAAKERWNMCWSYEQFNWQTCR